MDIEAVNTSYRRWAPIYDRTFGAVTNIGRARVVDYVNTRAGRVLEVGVGTGFTLPHYPAGVEVAAVDICPEMIAVAGMNPHAGEGGLFGDEERSQIVGIGRGSNPGFEGLWRELHRQNVGYKLDCGH